MNRLFVLAGFNIFAFVLISTLPLNIRLDCFHGYGPGSSTEMPNLQFSVNKDSANLDMANEFMRFLITSEELNEMAQKKGLMSPTKDLTF
nr:hypothetical protein [Lachnospiraceae bacterium]